MERGSTPLFVTVMVCAALAVPTGWLPKLRTVALRFITAGFPAAVMSGTSQIPRPYVATRSSPIPRVALAASATAGAFGRPVPKRVQQFPFTLLLQDVTRDVS